MKAFLLLDLAIAVALTGSLGMVFAVDLLVPGLTSGPETSFLSGIYRRRAEKDRSAWIKELGGSIESEDAVAAGLAWLFRHQSKDGSWSGQNLGEAGGVCMGNPPCAGLGGGYPVAETGLALLAFQAGGHFHFTEGDYADCVRGGLDYLVDQQRQDGGLYSRDMNMYEHGIAAFALAEACALMANSKIDRENPHFPREAEYRSATEKAIRFIEKNQHDDGGWRYQFTPTYPSDTSVSGWQVLALKSAREAQFRARSECKKKVAHFFKTCESNDGRTGYQPSGIISDATTGVGMLVHQFYLDTPDSALVKKSAAYLSDKIKNEWWGVNRDLTPDYYLWYNCSLAMFQTRRNAKKVEADEMEHQDAWEQWNGVLRDHLVSLQESKSKGCAAGSWAPVSRWGKYGGRVYTTALAVLTLEVYYRYAEARESAQTADRIVQARRRGTDVSILSAVLLAAAIALVLAHFRFAPKKLVPTSDTQNFVA